MATDTLGGALNSAPNSAINGSPMQFCQARVWHQRVRPFKHPLNYTVFCLRLRIDEPAELDRQTNWLFGYNRRRPVSFMNADHGYRDGGDLNHWLADTLAKVGVEHPGGAVWLQTFPRLLGYVFNPVSFWYVYDTAGVLRVIVAEVNNTFGQHHHYVLSRSDGSAIESGQALTCQKVFHVSPFCPVTGHYRFERVIAERPGSRSGVQSADGVADRVVDRVVDRMTIDYFDDESLDEPIIRTGIAVEPEPFSTARLWRAFISMPLMTFGVMWRIHWHALKLWRAGARFHRLPNLPTEEVTSNQELSR